LAGRVRLKIAYLLVRRILGLAVLVLRGQGAKEAELLVLRHKNAVLRRHAGWIQYESADRVWFAALAPLLPRPRWTDIFPTPTTPTRASPRKRTRHRPVVGGLINEYEPAA
jgi:putative transposase